MTETDRRTFLATAGSLAAVTSVAEVALMASEPAAEPIKVGQIGTKHAHASGKVATFRKFPKLFEVVGVVEDDPAQRARVEETSAYAGLKWLSQKELLTVDGLQAVAVETEVERLLDTAEACIERGLHIHLDKPAGTSFPHFKRICARADEKKLAIQMGYMFRGNAAFQFLFRAVRDGWLGDIFQVHCEMSKKVGDSTRRQLSRFAGGSMFELGCHIIDAVVTVLGAPDRVTPFNRNTRPDFDNLMDNCLAVFEYPKATATIRSSVSEVDGGRRRQFVVSGTKGTIVIQPLEPHQLTLTLESDTDRYKRGTHKIELPPSTGRYDNDFLEFAQAIQGQKPASFSTQHDLVVQEAILRASGMPLDE